MKSTRRPRLDVAPPYAPAKPPSSEPSPTQRTKDAQKRRPKWGEQTQNDRRAKENVRSTVASGAEVQQHAKSRIGKGDRLLTPLEVERAVMDRVLEPLHILPLSAVLKQLQARVEDEGGIARFALLADSSPSVISDALRGARGGIGRAAASYLGLRPTVLRVMAYKVVEPRKFYREKQTLKLLGIK